MNLKEFKITEKTEIHIEQLNYINDYFEITKSEIEINNGRKSSLYRFQFKMLLQLINHSKTFRSNQSHALYNNYYFEKDVKLGKFNYNMILLENGKVYLHNVTTGKFRRILYTLKQRISKKRKR